MVVGRVFGSVVILFCNPRFGFRPAVLFLFLSRMSLFPSVPYNSQRL